MAPVQRLVGALVVVVVPQNVGNLNILIISGHFHQQKNLSVFIGGWISVVLDRCDHTGTSLTPVLEVKVLVGFRFVKN